MRRGETRVGDSESVSTDERKSEEKREKVRELTVRERRHQKIMFPVATNKYNIYRRYNA